jgi:hypothetical protein
LEFLLEHLREDFSQVQKETQAKKEKDLPMEYRNERSKKKRRKKKKRENK